MNPTATSPAPFKKGLLLLNLGTPQSADPHHVGVYLKEFLMDPLVIDIPKIFRWFLVNALIVPKRSVSSAQAYQKIWTDSGSPLLNHLRDLTGKVTDHLDGPEAEWVVQSAMRYGSPSIRAAIRAFREARVSEILLLPLYPQYSLAATESSVREFTRVARKEYPDVPLKMVKPFYQHPKFIHAFGEVIRKSLEGYSYDHLLFSFHGLPERHIRKTDPTRAHCLKRDDCCDQITSANANCYRAQCYASARLIAAELGLIPEQYTVCFQSRLGATPWIKPYTDELYRRLPLRGVKRLAVVCPAFVADCLETLEEVQIRGKEEFLQYGGEDLRLVPSLNSSPGWVNAISEMISCDLVEKLEK